MANLFFPEAEAHAQAKARGRPAVRWMEPTIFPFFAPDVSPEAGRRPGSGGSPVVHALGGLVQTACPPSAALFKQLAL